MHRLPVLAALLLLAGTPADPPLVFVVSSLARVRPKDPAGTVREAVLKAARNEVEGVQLIVRAGSAPLENVRVEVSALAGPGGRSLPASCVSLFREHYIELKTPSPRSKEGPGWYPDALIPTIPKDASPPRFRGFPFNVPAGSNQGIYVELSVPKDAVPGDYSGELLVLSGQEAPAVVPLRLTVWDFELPAKPSLPTNFGGLGRRLQLGHPVRTGSPELRALERRYAESMSAHRLNPPVPLQVRPLPGQDGALPAGFDPAPMKEWIESLAVTSLTFPLLDDDPAGKDRARNLNYLRSLAAFLKAQGWDKMSWVHLFNEPSDADTYEEVRKRAALVREAAPGLRTLCTEQPRPTHPAWGTLAGSVDLWVPFWSDFDALSTAQRQRAGDAVWSSTAYCHAGPDGESPYWQIDFPLLNYRIAPWLTHAQSLDGLYYWTLVYWPESKDPWTNPVSIRTCNGEGVLFYPGAAAGVAGPVATLRLKALRDGLEDYEYLRLAGQAAPEIVAGIARTWTDWNPDPAQLLAAREALAKLIVASKK